jgi:hypothetical protein
MITQPGAPKEKCLARVNGAIDRTNIHIQLLGSRFAPRSQISTASAATCYAEISL